MTRKQPGQPARRSCFWSRGGEPEFRSAKNAMSPPRLKLSFNCGLNAGLKACSTAGKTSCQHFAKHARDLLVTQALDGIEPRRPGRGHRAEEDPHQRRDYDRYDGGQPRKG